MNKKPKDFYVYLHRRAIDGKVFYVGKGCGYRKSSKQRNKYWKRIVSKYGYTTEIYIDGIQEWYAFELEIQLIAYYGRENLCNFTDGGEGPAGWVPSEETKTRMKIAQNKEEVKQSKRSKLIGIKRHHDICKKISESQKGKIITDDCRKKLSESLKGRKHSEETIKKLIESQNKPETKQKRREKLIGTKLTEEHKQKISNSLKGRVFSDDSKKKSSLSQKGKPKSEEAKQKMREGWARKKLLASN